MATSYTSGHILHIWAFHLPDVHAEDLPNTGLGFEQCDRRVGCSEKERGVSITKLSLYSYFQLFMGIHGVLHYSKKRSIKTKIIVFH